jgi:hypothetical protein
VTEFRVPQRVRTALIKLAEQSDDAIDELGGLLESNPDMLTSRLAALEGSAKLKNVRTDDAFSIVEAIIPVLYFQASNPSATFVRDIVRALTTGEKNDPKLDKKAAAAFEKNLTRILSRSGVVLKAKAVSVATDVQRVFSNARILTDLRPVFGEHVSEQALGTVILHNLKIGFAENGRESEFFVTLDSQDLRNLQAHIERALSKEASLKTFVEGTHLKLIDTSSQE